MKTELLSALARYHETNRLEGRQGYPQTWWIVAKWPKWLRIAIQWVCGKTGHELSTTEWGYGGGDKADCWCRWCNKLVEVPKTSVYFIHPESRPLMKLVAKTSKCSDHIH